MFIAVLLFVFMAIILSLLFVKLILFVDTKKNEYYFQAKGLLKANVEADEEKLIRVRIRTLFMNFYFYPLKKKNTSKKPSATKKLGIKRKRPIGFRKGLGILRTFKVKQIFVDIDTGNCITNARLYPLFAFLNHNTGNFRINFEGKNQLILQIQNRPIHIIKSIINF